MGVLTLEMNSEPDIEDANRSTPVTGTRLPSLHELVARITDENRHGATDWGEAVGLEEW